MGQSKTKGVARQSSTKGISVAKEIAFLTALDQSAPRTFALEYRLSDTHRFPIPAALLDGLSGYYYLIYEIRYSPFDIIMAGDSAGGNLALALCRYLVEHRGLSGMNVNEPSDAPRQSTPPITVDLSDSHDWPGSSNLTLDMDFLDSTRSFFSTLFLGPFGMGFASLNRYISPASLHPSVQAHSQGFPRTFIVVGTAERFLDQIRTLKTKMISDMSEGEVTLFEAQDAVHDYILLNWHSQRPGTLKAIAVDSLWLSDAP